MDRFRSYSDMKGELQMKSIYSNTSKSLLLISLTYLFSQGFLLVLTGRWWDDWCMWGASEDILVEWAQQAALIPGKWIWLIERSMSDRWHFGLVFLLMYFVGILIYFILKDSKFFSDKACFYIIIIYVNFPCFDARAFLCVMLYVECLFLFVLAAYFMIRGVCAERIGSKIVLRLVSLGLFSLSFWTESLLFFYAVPFLYLYANEVRRAGEGKKISLKLLIRLIPSVFKYTDYILLPFLFYFWKRLYYPVYGRYAGYNLVSIKSIVAAMVNQLRFAFRLMCNIFSSDIWSWIYGLVGLVCLMILLFATKLHKYEQAERLEAEERGMYYILFGIIVLVCGIFPYEVIRGRALETVTITGRDSMLMPLGCAIIIYYMLDALRMQKRFIILIYCYAVLVSQIHFNVWYMEYQKDWYYQEAWAAQIANIEEVRDNNTFIILEEDAGVVGGHAFYTFTWNANRVFGDEQRLFMPVAGGHHLFQVIQKEQETIGPGQFGISNYDFNDTAIDGIIVSTCTISVRDVITLKFAEIFDKDAYEEKVKTAASLGYIPITPNQSDQVMKALEEGRLTREAVYIITGK